MTFLDTWTKLTHAELDMADDAAEAFEDAADKTSDGEGYVAVRFGTGADGTGVVADFATVAEAQDHIDVLLDEGTGWGVSDETEVFVYARFTRF